MLDSGEKVTLIPERLAEVVKFGEITHVRGVAVNLRHIKLTYKL